MNQALLQIKARIKNWSTPFLIKISKENSSELWREAASEILAEKGIQSNSKPSKPHLAVSIAKTTNKASHGAVIEQKQQPDWVEVIRQCLEWIKRDPQPNSDPDFIPY